MSSDYSKAKVDQYTEEELIQLVNESTSLKDLIFKLGYASQGGNNNITVKKRLDQYNIDYSHFADYRAKPKITRDETNIFIEHSTASQSTVRRWYKKNQYTPYICSICGLPPIWQDKELSLILDHINGISNDDRLENLRWVCPNCNQQLETTGFKKMRSKESKEQSKKVCPDCGREIWQGSEYCAFCAPLHRRIVDRPDRDTLKELIRTTPFTQIASKYGVSDNTIRKWCKAVNLPHLVKEIQKYDDSTWAQI